MGPRHQRAPSPARSEGEVDIAGALFEGSDDEQGNAPAATGDFDFDGFLNAGDDGGDDGDEAFIALQQAASFRKSSNLKGKSVKKGGGFQAMGMSSSQL